jgi:hypothetical protein
MKAIVVETGKEVEQEIDEPIIEIDNETIHNTRADRQTDRAGV